MTNNNGRKLREYELIVNCKGNLSEGIFYLHAKDILQDHPDVVVLTEPAEYNNNTGKYDFGNGDIFEISVDNKKILTEKKSLKRLTRILEDLGPAILREVPN